MDRALFTAATGLAAQQLSLDVIANNLANVSTAGFKASRVDFEDLIYQTPQEPGTQTGPNSMLPTGQQIGLGVSSGTTTTVNTQGTFQQTGRQYDLAIQGNGYFKILMPDGTTAYTRAGNFSVDGTGKLVTPDGYALQPEIVIPPDAVSFSVSPDGQVSVRRAGQQQATVVGQLQLTTFVNPAGLRAMGGNLFMPTPASGPAVDSTPGTQGAGTLQQGVIESSNVDIVSEMVRMIILQRAYETNSKVIQSADSMLGIANSIKQG
ncbi:flagellar basal-body rod protein FlgG [Chthonomonas calidirosea]|uniref:flagellar basal-body rod protein FlgG n=1 Tax=Chthonomonas calidirosea TaxID=454171 RepID=UPI0006DD53D1|nr:flagellar basal-body rod protein FlgG [Chthonomonas calidirosea]CEK17929.1 flagellar basal-body rod protein FlgG [Chthonomonas calidirosea]CEK17934.1 flagellar basal-body rod protein FlgG [Chthonomonas calidirosea]